MYFNSLFTYMSICKLYIRISLHRPKRVHFLVVSSINKNIKLNLTPDLSIVIMKIQYCIQPVLSITRNLIFHGIKRNNYIHNIIHARATRDSLKHRVSYKL